MKSHNILHLLFSITTSGLSSLCLYSISSTYFPMDLRSKPIMSSYTPFGLTCCIRITPDLHSLQLFHTFYIYCFFGLINHCFYVIGFYRLCSHSVVLLEHAFLSHPHRSSSVLVVVCLINCLCNCFCIHCVFLPFFFLFLYSFGVSLSTLFFVSAAISSLSLMFLI